MYDRQLYLGMKRDILSGRSEAWYLLALFLLALASLSSSSLVSSDAPKAQLAKQLSTMLQAKSMLGEDLQLCNDTSIKPDSGDEKSVHQDRMQYDHSLTS